MAIIDGKSTYAGVKRPRREGDSTTPLTATNPRFQTREEKIGQMESAYAGVGGAFQPENTFAGTTSFDPDLRGGGGYAGVAGSPKSPMEAITLQQSADMINQKAEAQSQSKSETPPVGD